jgi:serine/threonine-protein kinase
MRVPFALAAREMGNSEDSARDPMEGRVIQGRWRLERKLGAGGMGAVYLAEQLSIRGRRVAVKLLHGDLARDADYVERFRGEAERAATLTDPRIVTVFDFGAVEDGGLFIAMEYVRGETLAALIAHDPLAIERAVWFGIQLAEALQRVHEAGVIHRDVKPANVMVLSGSDALKLMDFGIARAANDSERTHRTQIGMLVGTPAYMAPEQITDGVCSVQTDIYAWGLVMYALLAGRKPFEGNSTEIQYKHVHEPPPPLRSFRPETPPAVEAVVLATLAKQPHQRPRSMAEVATALRQSEHAPTPMRTPAQEAATATLMLEPSASVQGTARRRAVWPLAVIAVLGAGGGVALMTPDLRGRIMFSAPNAPAPTPVAARPEEPMPLGQPNPRDAGPADEVTVVRDALALSEFFLDRGEYDSAISELEAALAKVPGDHALQAALVKARKARAAEEAVVGGGGN